MIAFESLLSGNIRATAVFRGFEPERHPLKDGATTVELVLVRHRSDPVDCPECGKKGAKLSRPSGPLPAPRNGQVMTAFWGLAYCEDHDLIDWAIEPP